MPLSISIPWPHLYPLKQNQALLAMKMRAGKDEQGMMLIREKNGMGKILFILNKYSEKTRSKEE